MIDGKEKKGPSPPFRASIKWDFAAPFPQPHIGDELKSRFCNQQARGKTSTRVGVSPIISHLNRDIRLGDLSVEVQTPASQPALY